MIAMNAHLLQQHSATVINSSPASALLQVSSPAGATHSIINNNSGAAALNMQQNSVSGATVNGTVVSVTSAAGQPPQNGCNNSVATNSSGSQSSTPTQSVSPPGNNAPKYGTLVPNRIFVGGISANTTEIELAQLFSAYGTVKATKIISDRAGVSKGYGFVTFETEDEAKRLQREADNIVLRERKLNIAPAIKKQPFSRPLDGSTPGSPPGSIPGLPGIPGTALNGPTAGFSYFPATAASNAAAAAALNTPYFQNGGVTYYNPTIPASGAPSDPTAAGVYPTPGIYPSAAQHQPPATQSGGSMTSSAAANISAVQQNIAAAQCAAAAAAGYPMLYPPAAAMYLPTCAAAGPQQYGYPPGHLPSNNGFLTTDATGVPYSLAPQPTYSYVPETFTMTTVTTTDTNIPLRTCNSAPAAIMCPSTSSRSYEFINSLGNIDNAYPTLDNWLLPASSFCYQPYTVVRNDNSVDNLANNNIFLDGQNKSTSDFSTTEKHGVFRNNSDKDYLSNESHISNVNLPFNSPGQHVIFSSDGLSLNANLLPLETFYTYPSDFVYSDTNYHQNICNIDFDSESLNSLYFADSIQGNISNVPHMMHRRNYKRYNKRFPVVRKIINHRTPAEVNFIEKSTPFKCIKNQTNNKDVGKNHGQKYCSKAENTMSSEKSKVDTDLSKESNLYDKIKKLRI